MKVHVICHGLFGIVVPKDCSFVDAVFLDAAGWTDPAHPIPRHDLFVRYTSDRGTVGLERLSRPEEIAIEGMPPGGGDCRILSRPISMADIVGADQSRLRADCATPGGACRLNAAPLVRTRLRLTGGELRNCEYDLVNGIDLDPQRGWWGNQHLPYTWSSPNGRAPVVSNTFNSVLFTFETGEAAAVLKLGGKSLAVGKASTAVEKRFKQLGKDFALITLNNTVPKTEAGGHFHVDANRDTHSLLFYEMLEVPAGAMAHRPIPQLATSATAGLEAPPLNRCIPYSYEI